MLRLFVLLEKSFIFAHGKTADKMLVYISENQ